MAASRLERRVQRKEERATQIAEQRDHFQKRQRNKRIINYAIGTLIVLAIGYVIYLSLDRDDGEQDPLARCLTSKGVTMYGTDWCPHCQAQKRLFGSSFRYVTYVNCDLSAEACAVAGVQGYPTWVFPGGKSLSGEQTLETLASQSGCVQ
jgi:glutaredoxin